MKTLLTFIFALFALTFGAIIIEDFANKTPEEKRLDAYYRCVTVESVEGRDIDNCNKIQ